MREESGGRIHAPGGDGDGARAEVSGAGDVVGRVADDDELRGTQIEIEMPVDARGSERGQLAAVV